MTRRPNYKKNSIRPNIGEKMVLAPQKSIVFVPIILYSLLCIGHM
jgi:hypothetical protein